ncbi:hypothetical protein V512_014520 [Mesotoga sp. Brook.08.105.5.1]|uniref:hypothetical protein n=1 Tax=Mesotoga sp. Brook.08.105.5.1 TaxID=1421002 RepID=UPI000C193DDB|nr:hypothetical protein [Mesotoga sp. Brook.08.105.5.1]PVD18083.1 hypothetical protein V512_014520 [Mesotoga sp. Brook.08.105.5.1]
MKCPECYSSDSRATPLKNPEDCLLNHVQYVCSTCGRAICMDDDERERHGPRASFSSFNDAMLYLRAAEALFNGPCGIYELTDGTKVFYKIFADKDGLMNYLIENPEKRCPLGEALHETEEFRPASKGQIQRLDEEKVEQYLKEKEEVDG